MSEQGIALDHKTLDDILHGYMVERGFSEAASRFKKESSAGDMVSKQMLNTHSALLHRIMLFNRKESNPEHYARAYQRLQNWMENSIDIYKHDMQRIMWPLLVHIFLDLVKKNFVHQALRMMESNSRHFKRNYVKEITGLQAIKRPQDIETNQIAKLFLEKKQKVEMSQYSHQLLISFLEQSNHMLLLSLINEHVQIMITRKAPLSRKDIQRLPSLTKGEIQRETSMNEKKFRFWGVLPGDQELHSTALDQGYGGIHQMVTATKGVPNQGQHLDKLITPSPMNVHSIPLPPVEERERQRRIQELKARARLLTKAPNAPPNSPGMLPSVCMYTFLNSESSTSVCVSNNASLVAAGFADSTVRTWNLTKMQNQAREVRLSSGKGEVGAPDLGVGGKGTGGGESSGELLVKKPSLVRRQGVGVGISMGSKGGNSGGGRGARGMEIDGGWPPYSKLVGHHAPVFSCDFSNDGEFLLSGSQDSSIRLWNVETALGLACYKGHTFPVWDVSFSPVGYYFASASLDMTARLWSTHRGYPLRIFAGHRSDVQCVQFHPNANVLATGSADETVRVWDIQSGDCARLFRGHGAEIRVLKVAPNGRAAVSGDCKGRVILWDLPEGKMIAKLEGVHSKDILALDFSNDGGMLAVGSMDCSISLWDIRTHNGLKAPLTKFYTKNAPVTHLNFTPRNLLVAAGVYRVNASNSSNVMKDMGRATLNANKPSVDAPWS